MDEVSKVCLNRSPWFVHLLLLAAVLSSSCCTGKPSVIVVPKIVASAGETVLLPCSTTPSDDVPTVEWTKEGLSLFAFLYRDGCETFEMKNPVFRYRTNLIRHKLHNGNLSMVMSNLQPSDSGKYQCAIFRKKKKKVIATVELFVVVVSEPKLFVVPGVGGGLTLQCEAKCWFSEPKITFLDNQGNEISAEDPKRHEESSGCFTVKRRVTLQTATNRVTCRVHQPEIHQTRDSEIYLPDEYQGPFTRTIVITAAVTIIAIVLCSFIVRLVKKHGCPVRSKKCSPAHDTNDHRQSPVTQINDCTNDSETSPGNSNPTIPPSPESPHDNDSPKPEDLTKSDSSSQSTEEDSTNLDTSREMKRRSNDSSSAPVLSIHPPHERLRRSSARRSIRGSIRAQHRNTTSEDSEPLMDTGAETK